MMGAAANRSDVVYRAYLGMLHAERKDELRQEIMNARSGLIEEARYHPSFCQDALRNGEPQPMMLGRSSKENTYLATCMPGDLLFAGDIVDAFGEKFIVTEARPEDTVYRTGVLHQCNYLLRWQNFSPEIHKRFAFVDAVGYSAYQHNNQKIDRPDVQLLMYLPYDEESAQIFVGKRLPSHKGYDQFGEQMLFAFRVLESNPVVYSYNKGDHLLMLKLERELDRTKNEHDNLKEMICDYIPENHQEVEPMGHGSQTIRLGIRVEGRDTLRIGSSATYRAIVTDAEERDLSNEYPVSWRMACLPPSEGVAAEANGSHMSLRIKKDSGLVGTVVKVIASVEDVSASMEVEVTGFV